jgi:hypothetical protein
VPAQASQYIRAALNALRKMRRGIAQGGTLFDLSWLRDGNVELRSVHRVCNIAVV